MIDYFLILVASFLGVAYDVMSNIKKLRVKFPTAAKGEIVNTFFAEEWDSLIVSLLVFCTLEFILFVLRYNGVLLPDWFENWGMYAFAGVISYSGQRIAYKALGTAEKVLGDRVDKMGGN